MEKLTGGNYYEWKHNMKWLLMGLDLWELVDGTEVLPERATQKQQEKFRKRQNLAMSKICLSVSSNVQIYVRSAKTGKEAWDNIAKRFEEKSLTRIIKYRSELYSMTMSEEMPMVEQINHLKTVSERLESLDDIVAEKDLVMILLKSLPKSYHNLITALESLKLEDLTWEYVRDRVLTEYERRIDNRRPAGSSGRSTDGTFDALYAGGKYVKRCHYCQEKGHMIKDCEKKKTDEDNKMRKEREGEELNRRKENEDAHLAEAFERFDFQPEFALKVDIEGGNDEAWWLDSGASRHMTSRREDFHRLLKLSRTVNVVLADKTVIPAVGIGAVKMVLKDSEGRNVCVEFKNVLYVPDLKKRLISIPQMTTKGAEITFKKYSCELLFSGRKFDFGRRVENLYKLNSQTLQQLQQCNLVVQNTHAEL